MKRYHINPGTGHIGVCTAKQGNCRFAKDGVEPIHYSDGDEAYAAYERVLAETNPTLPYPAKKVQVAKVFQPNPYVTVTRIDDQTSKEEIAKILEKIPPCNVFAGRVSLEVTDMSKQYPDLQEKSDELVRALKESGVMSDLSRKYDWNADDAGNKEKLPEGFKVIAAGNHRTAFLHEPSNLVYKVTNAVHHESNYKSARTMERLEQESYALVDLENLSSEGARYAQTMFLNADDVPIIAQEYADPEIYDELEEEESFGFRETLFESQGLDDIGASNIQCNRETGELLLIDCLAIPMDFWDDTYDRLTAAAKKKSK